MFLLVRQNGKKCIDSSLWLVTYHLSVWIHGNLRFIEIPSTNVWKSKACFSWLMNIARGSVTQANPILLSFPCLISSFNIRHTCMYTYINNRYDVYYIIHSPIVMSKHAIFPARRCFRPPPNFCWNAVKRCYRPGEDSHGWYQWYLKTAIFKIHLPETRSLIFGDSW